MVNDLEKRENKNKKGSTIKKGTVQKFVKYVTTRINWGIDKEYIEFDRIREKKLDYREDEEEFEATIITEKTLGEVLAFLKTNVYNIYIPCLLCACLSNRRGEALGLRIDNLDFENDILTPKYNRVLAGNDVIDKLKFKTKKSKRYHALSEFVKKELQEHLKMNEFLENPYVCANIFLGDVPRPDYVSKTFHKTMLKVFNINMRLHDLRHCFNQILYENGASINERKDILGHTLDKTNEGYTKFSVKKAKPLMDEVGNAIEESFNNHIKHSYLI